MSKQDKDVAKFKVWVNDTTMKAQSLTKRAASETVCFVLASIAAYLTVIYGKAILIIFFELTSLLSNNGMSIDTSTNSKSFESARNIAFALTALVGGPFLVWRTILADKQTRTAQTQTAIAQEKASLDEQTHFTTLYIKSIELLGATRVVKKTNDEGTTYDDTEAAMELRLGAIYALERIARDSWKDHWPIMEVLTAYIRENSPYDIDSYPEIRIPNRRSDIQTIIKVIGKRNVEWIELELENKQKLIISDCNLTSTDFRNLNFSNTEFQNVLLDEANFQNCLLKNSAFISTRGKNTKFWFSEQSDLIFNRCTFEDGGFRYLHNTNMKLKHCHLIGFDFSFGESNKINIELGTCTNTHIVSFEDSSVTFDGCTIGIDNFQQSETSSFKFSNCIVDKNFPKAIHYDVENNLRFNTTLSARQIELIHLHLISVPTSRYINKLRIKSIIDKILT